MNEKWLWTIIAGQFSVIIAMAAHFMTVAWYWWVIGVMSVIIVALYLACTHFSRAEIAMRDPLITDIPPDEI